MLRYVQVSILPGPYFPRGIIFVPSHIIHEVVSTIVGNTIITFIKPPMTPALKLIAILDNNRDPILSSIDKNKKKS